MPRTSPARALRPNQPSSPPGAAGQPGPIRWTPVFERISDDKRRRVLESAKAAFARDGFAVASVNRIAQDAGISIGALYKYFRTKEDLFLAIIDESRALIMSTIRSILEAESGFFERVEALLGAAAMSAREDPDLIKLYVACTSEELAPLAPELSARIESASAGLYRAMVEEAQASGEVRGDIDPRFAAFLVDDIFLSVQFSFASTYFAGRLDAFVGPGASPVEVVSAALAFVRAALEPRGGVMRGPGPGRGARRSAP